MKLEYLDRVSPNQKPTLLLHGNDPAVVRVLSAALANLTLDRIELATFPGVEPVDQCSVVVQASRREAGIRRIGRNSFA
jgi:hypothetical protein